MTTVADIRAKYPQYADIPDDKLVQGFHDKFYSDMPFEQFAQKIGYSPKPAISDPSLAESAMKSPLIDQNPIVGAIEKAGQGVTGVAGQIAGGLGGLGAMATNAAGLTHTEPADVVRNVQGAMTYQPRTSAAGTIDKVMGAVQKPFDAAAAPIAKAVDNAGPAVQSIAPAAAQAVTDIAGLLVPGKMAAKAAETPIVEGAGKATGATPIEAGRSAGFKFAPSDVASRQPAAAQAGEIPGIKREGFTGSSGIRKDLSQHNTATATKLTGDFLGKPNATVLSTKDFETAKVPHFDTYKATGDMLGDKLTGSDDFQSNLSNAIRAQDPQSALKPKVSTQTSRILNAAQTGNLSGKQMIKDISWLRANGGNSVARMLEDEVETQLGAANTTTDQVGKFRDARTGLAQINNLQEATKGGQVDLQALARLDQKTKGKLLTGPLKIMADAAAAAPGSMRLPTGGVGPALKATTIAGGIKELAGGLAKKIIPGMDVTADSFQNKFGREATPTEASYNADVNRRPAPPSQAFSLSAPPGAAGSPPRQLGMEIAQGRPAAPPLDLEPSEGQVGVNPVQLGMEVAQGRPMAEQRLALDRTPNSLEPHQPSLLGHPGTPEGGGRPHSKKAKKRG